MKDDKLTLDQARYMAKITQKDMAKRLGIAESTYIDYEKYRSIFRMDVAYRFANIVGRPLDSIKFF